MNKEKNIFQKLKRSKNLPSLPQVLVKLIEACNSDKTTLKELSQITAKDPSLASKVLRLVNSPYMGLRDPVTSLEKAVLYLGADTIKNMAISASVLQVFSQTKSGAHFNLSQFWWHSLLCALISRRLAKLTDYKHPEEAFLSGLLHDIAKLIFWIHFPKEYGLLLSESGVNSEQLIAGEVRLGASHAEVGAWLTRRWNLDPLMADAVHYHHEPIEDIAHAFPLVKIVHVANVLSQGNSVQSAGGREIAQTVFGFSPSLVEGILSEAKEEILDVARSMDIPVEQPPDLSAEIQQESNEELLSQVKNISLLYGTLDNLLKADGQEAILTILERGLKILFDVPSLMFFLYDPGKEILMGRSPKGGYLETRINELVVPVRFESSLLIQSLKQNRILNSRATSDLSIADKQIAQLLRTDGMICIPLSVRHQYMGVIALGVRAGQTPRFPSQRKLMEMFAYHAAVSLYVDELKYRENQRIQAERMEAVSTMAGKVVHEVNNPLGIIKNYLKILGLKLPERHPSQEDITIINEEIDRVYQIVCQLTTFSQPDSGDSTEVDVNSVILSQMKLLRQSILQPLGISDHLSLGEGLAKVLCDPGRLKQVLSNLVKNAAEAMKNGGNIYIETRGRDDFKIKEADQQDDVSNSIEMIVRDDGPGIPEAIRHRLFEPFISSKGADHRGLGLTVVHNIVKELKGSIICESGGETGTVFKIMLPASTAGPGSG
ncbi:MAG TPA: HDOD domain-containing protein [Deltaproteobacteria bacterium]|nr:HDOD domain-containing protein [Deltaproteobacteria bacterium]